MKVKLRTIQPLSSFLAGTQVVIFCIDEDKRAVYQAIVSIVVI